ncbi:MAG: TIM44-like domain-containing protein [Betaproteobacteria bacterium]
MKKTIASLFLALLTLGFSASEADAARLGSGKSVGMQRQAVTPKPAAPAQQATPAPVKPAPATAPTPAPKRNWLGPIAGLAAGLGIAALLSHFGMGEGVANFLMIALLVMAAFVVFKLLFRRKAPEMQAATAQYESMQNAGTPHQDAAPLMPTAGASPLTTAPSQRIPDDFDTEGFLRVAKLNFVRLQAANDTRNLDDLRDFTGPELFAEIKLQIDERGNAAQQTDVVTLNAELIEVTTEGHRHLASVHFSGMIRETAGTPAAPFDEVWNLSKPTDGSTGWVIAGIQQVN